MSTMSGQTSLTVDFGDTDDQIRPRAYSESSAKKTEKLCKKLKQMELPKIFIEEVDDFTDFEPVSRQRAYTSPDDLFRQRPKARPGTPPPCEMVIGSQMRKQSSLEKIGAQPHKLFKVPEK